MAGGGGVGLVMDAPGPGEGPGKVSRGYLPGGEGKRERLRRSDAGRIDATERDIAALRWVAEMYSVRVDVMRVLLGQLGDTEARARLVGRLTAGREAAGREFKHPPAAGKLVSRAGVARVLRRWERAGWVRVQRIGGFGWVLPTPDGYRLAGIEPRPDAAYRRAASGKPGVLVAECWAPRLRMLPHVHAAGLVRLHYEARMTPGQRWM